MAGTPKSQRQNPSCAFEDYTLTRQVGINAGLTNISFDKFTKFKSADLSEPNFDRSIGLSGVGPSPSGPYNIGFDFLFDNIIYDRYFCSSSGLVILIPKGVVYPDSAESHSSSGNTSPLLISSIFANYDYVLLCPWYTVQNSVVKSIPNNINYYWDGGNVNLTNGGSNNTSLSAGFSKYKFSKYNEINNYNINSEDFYPSTSNGGLSILSRMVKGQQSLGTRFNDSLYGCRYYLDTQSSDGVRLIIRWYSIANVLTHAIDACVITYEVVIYQNGKIEFRYNPRSDSNPDDEYYSLWSKRVSKTTGVNSAFMGINASGPNKGSNRFRDFSDGLGFKNINSDNEPYKYGGLIAKENNYDYIGLDGLTNFGYGASGVRDTIVVISPGKPTGGTFQIKYWKRTVSPFSADDPMIPNTYVGSKVYGYDVTASQIELDARSASLFNSNDISVTGTDLGTGFVFKRLNNNGVYFYIEVDGSNLTGGTKPGQCLAVRYIRKFNFTLNAKDNWPAQKNVGATYTFSPPQNRRKILPNLKIKEENFSNHQKYFDDRYTVPYNKGIYNFPTKINRFTFNDIDNLVNNQDLFTYDFLVTSSLSPGDNLYQFLKEKQNNDSLTFTDRSYANVRSKTEITLNKSVNYSTVLFENTSSIYYLDSNYSRWVTPSNSRTIYSYSYSPPTQSIIFDPNEIRLPKDYITLISQDYKGFDPVGNFFCSSSNYHGTTLNEANTTFNNTTQILGKSYNLSNLKIAYDQSYPQTITSNDNFHPENGESLNIPIKQPFLLEKAIIEFPLAAGPGWFADKTSCVRRYDDASDFNNDGRGFDFGGPGITVSLFNQIGNKPFSRRELILSGTITHANDNVNTVNFSYLPISPASYQIRPQGFNAFGSSPSVVINPSVVDGKQTFTGSVTLVCEPAIGNGIMVRVSQKVLNKSAAYNVFNSSYIDLKNYSDSNIIRNCTIAYINNFGRSAGGLDTSGRSIFGGEYVTKLLNDNQVTNPFYQSGELSNDFKTILESAPSNQVYYFESLHSLEGSKYSPYLLQPGDKLVLAISKTRPVFSGVAVIPSGDSTIKHDIQLFPGQIKITLFGSYVKDGNEYQPPLEQPLNTNTIRETIGNYPVLDQYDVEYRGTYVDSMADDAIEGYLVRSIRNVDGTLGIETGSRGKQYSLLNPIEEQPLNPWITIFSSSFETPINNNSLVPQRDINTLLTGSGANFNQWPVWSPIYNTYITASVIGLNTNLGTITLNETTASYPYSNGNYSLSITPQSITVANESKFNAPGMAIPITQVFPNFNYDIHELRLTYEKDIGFKYVDNKLNAGSKCGFCLLPISQSNSNIDPIYANQGENINNIPTGGGFNYFVGIKNGWDDKVVPEINPYYPNDGVTLEAGKYGLAVDVYSLKNSVYNFVTRNFDLYDMNPNLYSKFIIVWNSPSRQKFYASYLHTMPYPYPRTDPNTTDSVLFTEASIPNIDKTVNFNLSSPRNNLAILLTAYDYSAINYPPTSSYYNAIFSYIKLEYRIKDKFKPYNFVDSYSDRIYQYKEKSNNVRFKLTQAIDLSERYYDSMLPSIAESFSVDGKEIILWQRGAPYINTNFNKSNLGIILFDDEISDQYWKQMLPNDNKTSKLVHNKWTRSFPFEEKYKNVVRCLDISTTFYSKTKVINYPYVQQLGDVTTKETKFEIVETSQRIIDFVIYAGNDNFVDTLITDYSLICPLNNFDIIKILFGFGNYSNLTYKKETRNLRVSIYGLPYTNPVDLEGYVGSNNLLECRANVLPNGIKAFISPIVRGWKYGIYNGLPTYSKAYFRQGKYGQFRDMLEQRQDTKFYLLDEKNSGLQDAVVQVKFVHAEDGTPQPEPENTSSQNISYEAASLVPYFDGEIRNREAPYVGTSNAASLSVISSQNNSPTVGMTL